MSTQLNKDLRVADLLLPLDRIPVLSPKALLKTALEEMGKSRLGIVCLAGPDGKLEGILTDGDVRRQLLTVQKPFSAFFGDDVIDHAIKNPSTVSKQSALLDAVNLMEEKQIWDLPVLDEENKLCGLLHLHPVVQYLLQNEK